MTKPSKRKASPRKVKPGAKRTVKRATKPAPKPPTVEEELAKFDHDGDGHPGGSLPAPETVPAPDAEPVAETLADPEPSAPADRVMLGSVTCRLKRLSTKVVLRLLSEDSLRRVGGQSAPPELLRQQMLASDGHATPVFFEDGDPPTIMHGFEELAIAVDCGIESVSVLLIPAGGAAEAQSHIVEMVRLQRMKGQTTDDDEMFWRVNARG